MRSVATAKLSPAKKRTPNLATKVLATAAIVVIAVASFSDKDFAIT
jgi:hypothetical protein